MFPPKGELTLDTAREVAGNLCKLSPSFVSVTCSAGGSSNGATTAPIAHMITSEFDTPSVAHLTCVGRSHADIAAKIDEYRTAGVENILALRGDLPAGATEDDKPASDYAYARDLIPELVDACLLYTSRSHRKRAGSYRVAPHARGHLAAVHGLSLIHI